MLSAFVYHASVLSRGRWCLDLWGGNKASSSDTKGLSAQYEPLLTQDIRSSSIERPGSSSQSETYSPSSASEDGSRALGILTEHHDLPSQHIADIVTELIENTRQPGFQRSDVLEYLDKAFVTISHTQHYNEEELERIVELIDILAWCTDISPELLEQANKHDLDKGFSHIHSEIDIPEDRDFSWEVKLVKAKARPTIEVLKEIMHEYGLYVHERLFEDLLYMWSTR